MPATETQREAAEVAAEKPFAPEAGVGVPVAVFGFGFSVIMLGLANARVFSPNAVGIFVPVALGTGALTLLVAGLYEFRANNAFGGTFCIAYTGFLLTTALIIRYYGPGIITAAGALGYGDAFGAWLLIWCVFTVGLAVGAYHINLPALAAFGLLALAYLILGIANVANPGDTVTFLAKLGGWVLIADGIAAWYLGWASLMNVTIGSNLPLWPYPYQTAERSAVAAPPPAVTA
jgi:succinate-acetate transporter protein